MQGGSDVVTDVGCCCTVEVVWECVARGWHGVGLGRRYRFIAHNDSWKGRKVEYRDSGKGRFFATREKSVTQNTIRK